jgi:hypothetical protein
MVTPVYTLYGPYRGTEHNHITDTDQLTTQSVGGNRDDFAFTSEALPHAFSVPCLQAALW